MATTMQHVCLLHKLDIPELIIIDVLVILSHEVPNLQYNTIL